MRKCLANVSSWGHLLQFIEQGVNPTGIAVRQFVTLDGYYMARYVCKNVVAAGLADEMELQIAYAIGVAHPVSVFVDTFGTGKLPDDEIANIVRKEFDLRPAAIIKKLNLRRPLYAETAAYGHFGREGFPWEETDRAEDLKKYLG